jgi:hypothetical protein
VFVFENDILVLVKGLVRGVFTLVFALESALVSGSSDMRGFLEVWRGLRETKRLIVFRNWFKLTFYGLRRSLPVKWKEE